MQYIKKSSDQWLFSQTSMQNDFFLKLQESPPAGRSTEYGFIVLKQWF